MKSITRNHEMENKLNLVRKGRKYFYLSHEKDKRDTKIPITILGQKAFEIENWAYFQREEARKYGGTV